MDDKKYTLTDSEVQLIGDALAVLPFHQVERLVVKLRRQFAEQVPQPPEDKADE